jgi:hypothetical protein
MSNETDYFGDNNDNGDEGANNGEPTEAPMSDASTDQPNPTDTTETAPEQETATDSDTDETSDDNQVIATESTDTGATSATDDIVTSDYSEQDAVADTDKDEENEVSEAVSDEQEPAEEEHTEGTSENDEPTDETATAAEAHEDVEPAGEGDDPHRNDEKDATSRIDEKLEQGFQSEEYEEISRQQEEQSQRRREQQNASKRLEFNFVRPETLTKIEAVFVDTEPYTQLVKNLKGDTEADSSIYLVVGARKTGRYALALRLAMELNGDQSPTNIREYIPDITTRSLSIEDVIMRIRDQAQQSSDTASDLTADETEISSHAIIIVRDAFADAHKRDQLRELRAEFKRPFSHLLGSVRLILTTSITPAENPDVSNHPFIPTQDTRQKLYVDLHALYNRHLDFYVPAEYDYNAELRDILQQAQDTILQELSRPFDIDKFFERVTFREPETVAEAIELAKSLIGGRAQLATIRKWFESFEKFNQKLYVMFAVMFEGLKRSQIDDLYDEAVVHLRSGASRHYEDPRYISVRTMLDDIHMEEKESETLEFIQNHNAYSKVVRDQMRDYYRLLWGLVDLFVGKIKHSPSARDRRLRRLLASNIGKIGVYRQSQLQRILTDMLKDDRAHVPEAAIHILIEISNQIDYHDFVIKVIRDWLNTRQTTFKFTAMGAIAGVYQQVAETFKDALDDVTSTTNDDSNTRLARQTLRTLRQLLEQYCDTIDDVDEDASYKRLRKALEETRGDRERELLESLLNDGLIKLLWQSSDNFQQDLKRRVQNNVNQQIERLMLSAQVSLRDGLQLIAVDRLTEMLRNLPDQMVTLFQDWLQDDATNYRWQTARMTINAIFADETNAAQNFLRPEQRKLFTLLSDILRASGDLRADASELLISGALGSEFGEIGTQATREFITKLVSKSPIEQVLAATERWYGFLQETGQITDETDDNIWYHELYPEFVQTVNHTTQSLRLTFVNALLNTWLKSTHATVVRDGTMLFRRALALNGTILDLPTSRHGVLMLDTSDLGDNTYSRYLNLSFRTAQWLAMLAPLHIYHLGRIDPEHPLQIGNLRDDSAAINTIHIEDLQVSGMNRAPLMLPALEPLDREMTDVDQCHYVLALNINPIIDWHDLLHAAVDRYEAAQQALREYNPFADDADDTPDDTPAQTVNPFATQNPFADDDPINEDADAPPPPTATSRNGRDRADDKGWRWHGKLIVNDPQAEDPIPAILPEGVVAVYQADEQTITDYQQATRLFEDIRGEIAGRIIYNLHNLSVADALDDLARYYHATTKDTTATFETVDALATHLETWLDELSGTSDHLRVDHDPALLLNWSILLMARVDLPETCQLILEWFDDPDDDSVRRALAKAATQQLFRYFGISSLETDPAQHGELLQLLPALLSLDPAYHEFNWVLNILLTWSRDKAWSDRLISNPNGDAPELLTAIGNLYDQNVIEKITNEVLFREASLRTQEVFLQMRERDLETVDDFISIINGIIQEINAAIQQRQQPRRRRRRRGERPTRTQQEQETQQRVQQLSIDQKRRLMELPGLNDQNRQRIVNELRRLERRLHTDPAYAYHHAAEMINQKAVLDTMRLQLYSKNTQIPELPDDTHYGIIFVDVTSNKESAREQSTTFVADFLNAIVTHEDGAQVVPIVHRMGRHDVVYTHKQTTNRKRRVKLKPETIWPEQLPRRFHPVIGPILDRYPPESVRFVIVITDTDVYDLEDWAKMASGQWLPRLFLYPLSPRISDYGIENILNEDVLEANRSRMTTNNSERTLTESIANRIMRKTHKA